MHYTPLSDFDLIHEKNDRNDPLLQLPILQATYLQPFHNLFYKLPILRAAYFIASYIFPFFPPRRWNPRSEGKV